MKDVKITYHEAQIVDGTELVVSVEDEDQVSVIDARKVAGADTHFKFLVQSEKPARSRGNGDSRRRSGA